jgi:hypothetical protein
VQDLTIATVLYGCPYDLEFASRNENTLHIPRFAFLLSRISVCTQENMHRWNFQFNSFGSQICDTRIWKCTKAVFHASISMFLTIQDNVASSSDVFTLVHIEFFDVPLIYGHSISPRNPICFKYLYLQDYLVAKIGCILGLRCFGV